MTAIIIAAALTLSVIFILIYYRVFFILPFLLVFIIVITLSTSMFIVTEGSQAVITQFGEMVGKPYKKAGLYFKIPLIWKVNYFDTRIYAKQVLAANIPTKDGYFIGVDIAFHWKIEDTEVFFEKMPEEMTTENIIQHVISGQIRQTISKYNLYDIMRTDNLIEIESTHKGSIVGQILPDKFHKMKDDLISERPMSMGRIKLIRNITSVANKFLKQYGIKVLGVVITDFQFTKAVETVIENRMKQQILRKVSALLSSGLKVVAEMNGLREVHYQEILAPAVTKSQDIRGKADSYVTQIYAESYGKNIYFYKLYETLQTYKRSLPQSSKGIILSTDAHFLNLLKNLNQQYNGDLKAKKINDLGGD